MNSYLNDRKAIDRLKKEYLEHKNLIIGFDFDCTIYDYHKEDLEVQSVIDLLARCARLKFTMCIHTLMLNKADMSIDDKIDYCIQKGIYVGYINCSPVLADQNEAIGYKPFYSILLDDRAGLASSYNILKTTLNELNL